VFVVITTDTTLFHIQLELFVMCRMSLHASSFELKYSPFQKPQFYWIFIKISSENSWKSDLLIYTLYIFFAALCLSVQQNINEAKLLQPVMLCRLMTTLTSLHYVAHLVYTMFMQNFLADVWIHEIKQNRCCKISIAINIFIILFYIWLDNLVTTASD